MPCYGQRRMVRLLQAEKKARVSQITTCAKKCIQKCSFAFLLNTKRILKNIGSKLMLLSNWRETEAAIYTESPKLDNRILKKMLLVRLVSLDFCCNIQMVGLKFDVEKK